MIRAVTFDLWDTLVFDDSDEPERERRGLRSKRAERRAQAWQALSRCRDISPAEVSLGYDICDAAFERVWRHHHITWTLAERIDVLCAGLGCSLGADERAELAERLGRMEVDIPPQPIPGAAASLQALRDRGYRLAIVSDAIVTPGRGLRELLAKHELAQHFDAFAFSDEVGRSKPHRRMFEAAAAELGVALGEIVHVGDRDHNDVKGPHAVGMKAVLFVEARAADRDQTRADAVCERFSELPALVDELAGRTTANERRNQGATSS